MYKMWNKRHHHHSGPHHGGHHQMHGHMPGFFRKGSGAQTFRRGKILHFLERLYVRKGTLQQQLEKEEYKSIHPVISGELKALEMVINELVQEFDLNELYEEMENSVMTNQEQKKDNEEKKDE